MKLLPILSLIAAGTGLLSTPVLAKDHDDDHDRDKKHNKHSESYYHDSHSYSHGSHSNVTIGIGTPYRSYYGNGYGYGSGYGYGRSSTVIVERQRPVYYERDGYSSGRGYSGRSVEFVVQRGLASRGYYRGPIDGDIGPGSRASIRAFQSDNGFAPTGRIDHGLVIALR